MYMRVCVYMCVDGYMHVCFYMCVDGYMHVCAKCRCTCVCMSVASAGLRTAVHSVTIQHSLFPVCVHVLICWKQLKTHSGGGPGVVKEEEKNRNIVSEGWAPAGKRAAYFCGHKCCCAALLLCCSAAGRCYFSL